jgi:hypothetical protein
MIRISTILIKNYIHVCDQSNVDSTLDMHAYPRTIENFRLVVFDGIEYCVDGSENTYPIGADC